MTRLVRVGAYALVVAAVMALPAAAATGDPMQGITVTGVGSMEAAPDVSAWSFGVSNRESSAK